MLDGQHALVRKRIHNDFRLRKRKEFLQIQKLGARAHGNFFIVIACEINREGLSKFGITVAKKVGKAHERNKIKRRIRHIMRLHPNIYEGRRLVVIAKNSSNDADFSSLKRDLLHVAQKLNRISSYRRKSILKKPQIKVA